MQWVIGCSPVCNCNIHDKRDTSLNITYPNSFKPDNNTAPIPVEIENKTACQRFSGVSISNITIGDSPRWLKQRLKAIGIRPINNIVDITNYIQHETGQPLHAYDRAAIKGNKIVVRNLPEGTVFVTLDEKRKKAQQWRPDGMQWIRRNVHRWCIRRTSQWSYRYY